MASLANLASLGEKQQDFKHLVQVCHLASLDPFLASLAHLDPWSFRAHFREASTALRTGRRSVIIAEPTSHPPGVSCRSPFSIVAPAYTPADTAATIYSALGMDLGAVLTDREGRSIPMLPVGQPIKGVL